MSATLIPVDVSSKIKLEQGFVIAPIDNPCNILDIKNPPQYILLGENEWFASNRHGHNFIFCLTGRTRKFQGGRVVTVEVFDIQTVVKPLKDGTPALWGVRGDRIDGVWFTSLRAMQTI
jgi:hypothetical protein